MTHSQISKISIAMAFFSICTDAFAGNGWSVVSHLGSSRIDNQSATITGAGDLPDGPARISLDAGFAAGLGIRYDYANTPWISEFGWEYRSNDASTTPADGSTLPDGNYASNVFYINARYKLGDSRQFTPWIGGGLTWLQEIDLDSEDALGERSFSDSGSVGYQLILGADHDISDRLYLSGEIRYSSIRDITLSGEGSSGRVENLNYEPLTFGIGIGLRF